MRREKVDEGKSRVKPSELSSGIEVRAAAIKTGDTRVAIEKPI